MTVLRVPRISMLGSGTCRIDPARGQTSACVIDGENTFVFDLGFGALERLERAGAFEACSELHVHLSHRHTDHVIGIFPLLQCLTWSDDHRHRTIRRVVVHATEEVCQLVEGVRSLWGFEETKLQRPFLSGSGGTFEYRPGPNYQDWNYTVGSLQVSSIHLPGVNNHGALCEIGGRKIGFTGDATEMSEALVDFCKRCDICVFDFGHLMDVIDSEGTPQADLEKIVELLVAANPPQARAAHVYLRHLQDRTLSQSDREAEIVRLVGEAQHLAQRRGFTGRLSLAYDGEVL